MAEKDGDPMSIDEDEIRLDEDEIRFGEESADADASAAPVSLSDELRREPVSLSEIAAVLNGQIGAHIAARISAMMINFGDELAGDLSSHILSDLTTYGQCFDVYLPAYLDRFIPLFMETNGRPWIQQFFADFDLKDYLEEDVEEEDDPEGQEEEEEGQDEDDDIEGQEEYEQGQDEDEASR
ncbi:PREDICTED: uncharacterized protein LOC101306706 [Fragaria vesca subsp. vesca]|uniref:uncharacterized protein LOC101306706 n=1 Tax=Fragaria vesca subsp. vesca TaxID=101020 RepID=UPI0002C3160E|nr:PREDICTED: uncharacterized protein LOC101306706 [Fragaria vesca subsp. vesca]